MGTLHKTSASRDLVDARVDMPADIRQHAAFQIFVFEKDRAPRMIFVLSRQVLPQCVGMAELVGRISIERRVRIRGSPLRRLAG
jgi:hypothetical protein